MSQIENQEATETVVEEATEFEATEVEAQEAEAQVEEGIETESGETEGEGEEAVDDSAADDVDANDAGDDGVATEAALEESVEETVTPEFTAEMFAAMQAELEELKAYKLAQENAQKDALIAKYFMLDDEDKANVIAHKEEYTLDEIESQLALIYVKKNVDFSTIDGAIEDVEAETEDPITTFSLDSEVAEIVPAAVARLRETN